MAPSGLYARLCHAFLVLFFFFLTFPFETNYFRIYGTDLHRIFMNGRLDLWANHGSDFCSPIAERTTTWQPILGRSSFLAFIRRTGVSQRTRIKIIIISHDMLS